MNSVVVPDRVLSKEIENDEIWSFQSNMFATEGAAAYGVGFIIDFLVTGKKGEFVDEIHSGGTMAVSHHLRH